MKKKYVIILGAAVIYVLLAWSVFSCSSDESPKDKALEQPQALEVKKGDMRVIVEATGRIVPNQEVEIKCKASGEVINLPVDISDTVKKGDILVQLDPDEEERNLKRAEVSLAVSKARLAQARLNLKQAEQELASEKTRAKASLASAEAKAREAEARLKRVEQLQQMKMASQEELDTAWSDQAQANANLTGARSQIKDLDLLALQITTRREDVIIAEAQVTTDEIALSDARQRLADTTVPAPIDGEVAEKNVQVGQIIASGINNVGGGTTVMTLVDLSRIFVLVSVDESDIGKINNGRQARITVDAYPNKLFKGSIVRVATKGTNTSNVVTFEVKIEVEDHNSRLLKPEMTANVEIIAIEKTGILLLPVTAITRHQQNFFADVKKPDGSVEQRQLETGASDGESFEIISGVSEGDVVVLPDKDNQGFWKGGEDRPPNAAGQDRMRMRAMRNSKK